MELKKITRKINALSKKHSFCKILFDNPVPLTVHLQITARIPLRN